MEFSSQMVFVPVIAPPNAESEGHKEIMNGRNHIIYEEAVLLEPTFLCCNYKKKNVIS